MIVIVREDFGVCIGCDDEFSEYDYESGDIHEVTCKYGDGFAHADCIVEGMELI